MCLLFFLQYRVLRDKQWICLFLSSTSLGSDLEKPIYGIFHTARSLFAGVSYYIVSCLVCPSGCFIRDSDQRTPLEIAQYYNTDPNIMRMIHHVEQAIRQERKSWCD